MDSIEIKIPETSFKNDFTIIYKGMEEHEGKIIESIKEINTSKEEFLRKLRFFKKRTTEINQMNEIYIHDSYSIELFKEFIDSLKTHKIDVNEDNYSKILELSRKYQYEELESELQIFSKTRPDLQSILKNSETKEIDSSIEEKLSKNLDICLQNQYFDKLPIPTLVRILNSPTRVLHDHHLLIEFIIKIIKKYNHSKSEQNEEDTSQENLQILLGCLDYSEMSNDEIDEFLNNDELVSIFNLRNSKERMKKFVEESKKNEKRFSEFEKQILSLEQKLFERTSENENKMKKIIDEMKNRFDKQGNIISEYKKSNDELQKVQQEQSARLNLIERQLHDYEEMKEKIMQLEAKNLKYQKENAELKHLLSENETKLKSIEDKLRLQATISAKVGSNQKIEGMINIYEGTSKLDKKRSKYILNKNKTQNLSESEYKDGKEITSTKQAFSFCKLQGTYFLHALIADENGRIEQLISDPLTTKGVRMTFSYTGTVQSVSLPAGSYKLEVWGSSGGENKELYNNGIHTGYAGKGGYSVGTLNLNSETRLYIYVGGCPSASSGGWNGGGDGRVSASAGGGGSTDISLYGEEGSTEWNTANHLYSRIIVAGGGGGSSHSSYPQWQAGCGGGETGEDSGENYASGGSQTSGNAFGIGGKSTRQDSIGSGGGGGWYGGGAFNECRGWGLSGAGGSGFVYNSTTAVNYPSGCKLNSSFYLVNSNTISGNTEIPATSGNGTEIGHTGNGFAIITLL